MAAKKTAKKAPETFSVKVLVKIRDKHTGKIHNSGEILEMTQERFDEIAAVRKDLVAKVEQPEADEEPEQAPEEQPEAEKAE